MEYHLYVGHSTQPATIKSSTDINELISYYKTSVDHRDEVCATLTDDEHNYYTEKLSSTKSSNLIEN